MMPWTIIEKLLLVDKKVALIILGGLGTFAAVAVVQAFKLDWNGSLLIAGYVVGFGVLLFLLSTIIDDQTSRTVISRFLTFIFMLFMSALFVGAVMPHATFINPPSCLIRFWAPCRTPGGVIDNLVDQAQLPKPSTVPPLGDVGALPSGIYHYRVYIQFAGEIKRGDVVAVAHELRAQGWNVEGANQGGERLAAGAYLNEIR